MEASFIKVYPLFISLARTIDYRCEDRKKSANKQRRVQRNSKTSCHNFFPTDPVGPEFADSHIHGYKLSLTPGAAVKLID
jgi:hypothetical protein